MSHFRNFQTLGVCICKPLAFGHESWVYKKSCFLRYSSGQKTSNSPLDVWLFIYSSPQPPPHLHRSSFQTTLFRNLWVVMTSRFGKFRISMASLIYCKMKLVLDVVNNFCKKLGICILTFCCTFCWDYCKTVTKVFIKVSRNALSLYCNLGRLWICKG